MGIWSKGSVTISLRREIIMEELKFLKECERQLSKELQDISKLEEWINEAKNLLKRTMSFVGRMTEEEFKKSPSYEYTNHFLNGTLEK